MRNLGNVQAARKTTHTPLPGALLQVQGSMIALNGKGCLRTRSWMQLSTVEGAVFAPVGSMLPRIATAHRRNVATLMEVLSAQRHIRGISMP